MVADRNVRARQIGWFGNPGISWNHNGRLTNTVSLPPHNAFFDLRRLVYSPMASAADIAGAFTLASMSFGVTLERAKTVVLERNRRIDSG